MSVLLGPAVAFAANFNIKPDASAPGVAGIQKATNLVAEYALLICGAAAVMSILMLVVAKAGHLERAHAKGKEGFVLSLGAAFVVGIIGALLNMAYGL